MNKDETSIVILVIALLIAIYGLFFFFSRMQYYKRNLMFEQIDRERERKILLTQTLDFFSHSRTLVLALAADGHLTSNGVNMFLDLLEKDMELYGEFRKNEDKEPCEDTNYH